MDDICSLCGLCNPNGGNADPNAVVPTDCPAQAKPGDDEEEKE